MSIEGVLLQPFIDRCPYLEQKRAVNEHLLVRELSNADLEMLLSMGFRHFGDYFFRPICSHCRACIPIRVPVQQFKPSRSVRRLFNRNRFLTASMEKPVPSPKYFEIYKQHKERFKGAGPAGEGTDDYVQYLKSFYHPFSFNRMLTIKDGDKVIAVSHLDVTANIMSAIYCYFDKAYARYSPGKFAVYLELQIAARLGCRWLYLGYYIRENRHTNYKVQFKPNQVMADEHKWIDYMDQDGNILNPLPQPGFHLLADYGYGLENSEDEKIEGRK
jgi:arginine-tRNA-protein transferase